MSMKSFDKFCEKLILSEPNSEKEIYDERQKLMRMWLLVQALTGYAAASTLCVLLNELMSFLESSFSGMVFLAAAAYLWYVIMAAVRGCLFGVSGKQTVFNAIIVIGLTPSWIITVLPDSDEPPLALIRNGVLTEKAVILAAFILYLATSVIVLVINSTNKHKEGKAE